VCDERQAKTRCQNAVGDQGGRSHVQYVGWPGSAAGVLVLANREGYGLEIGSVSWAAAGNPARLRSGVNVVAVSAGTQMTDLTFTDHSCLTVGGAGELLDPTAGEIDQSAGEPLALALADSDLPSVSLVAVDER
jgi:hypothetical protein